MIFTVVTWMLVSLETRPRRRRRQRSRSGDEMRHVSRHPTNAAAVCTDRPNQDHAGLGLYQVVIVAMLWVGAPAYHLGEWRRP